jgi:predicted RecA/RadA family phage recombinase
LLLLCLVAEAIDVAGQSGELAPEDVLQIALRMASEIPEETVVDFEEALDTLAAGGKQQMAEKCRMINKS